MILGQTAARHPSPEEWRILRQALLESKATVRRWGGELRFVYLPGRNRYARPRSVARRGDYSREQVLSLARSLDLPVIDLKPAFDAHGDPLGLFPLRRFVHYNERGHRLVADHVLKAIPAVTDRTDGPPDARVGR